MTTWPLIKREYLSRVTTKGFWIGTAIVPLMIFGFTVLPSLLLSRTKASPEPIRIVDSVGDFFPVLDDVIKKTKKGEKDPPVQLEPIGGRSIDVIRKELNDQAENGKIQGYFVVDKKSLDDNQMTFYARNPTSALSGDVLRSSMREAITRYRLSRLGVGGEAIDTAVRRINLDVQKATNDPKKKGSTIANLFMSISLVMFIYITLIVYGIYILRGVLEEKSNRIVEVIVSSVTPFQMMMGKILGIGAVGLTQIAIWVSFALLLSGPQIAGFFSLSRESLPTINAASLIFFPVYFVLGYFLYATIYAGIGSMFNSDEDAQQMMGVANMFLVAPMMLLMPVMKNPGGSLATWLSLFPFFSPILMYLRINVQMPPAWQIALSIVLMTLTVVFMIWLVSKIYRVGILMYGKKPTIPELLRWLRYT